MFSKTNAVDYSTTKSFLKGAAQRGFYLDVNSLPSLLRSTGKTVIVPPECEHRIDLFSYQQYSTSRLWWVIALANADIIKDPIWDFKSGMSLFVPTNNQLLEQLTGTR